jgi:hypothetical protein
MPDKYTTRNNFVPALHDPAPSIVEIEVPRELPAPPQTVLLPQANYTDRAKGFSLATAPLAAVVGLVVALVAIIGWQVPVASLATLLLALGGFALVWLIAYLGHVLISPDGATFFHVLLAWKYLRAEQAERHRRYKEMNRGK